MELPRGGILGRALQAGKAVGALRLGLHAAHTGYFLCLSLFPALALLMSLLRYTQLDAGHLVALLEGIVPNALLPEAELLIHSLYQSGAAVPGISAVTALWSASRGVFGLLTGLNAVYGVSESRGYVYTRAISLFYTFAFLLVLLLTLVLHVFGAGLLELLQTRATGFWRFLLRIVDLRFFLLLALQTALFTAMYMALPNRKNPFSDSLPGAFLASSGWLIFSHLFSLYVDHFNHYGGAYVVALSMLWLYFCILILFYGALLNRWILQRGS